MFLRRISSDISKNGAINSTKKYDALSLTVRFLCSLIHPEAV